MRKFILSIGIMISAFFVLSSCSNEENVEPREPVVQENNISDGTVEHTLSVHVVSSSSPNARIAGLEGAEVTVSQNGNEASKTVDADGIATFSNLSTGEVSVFVSSDGHASVNTSTTLNIDKSAENLDNKQKEFERLQISLPRMSATLKGSFYHEIETGTGGTDGSAQREVFNYVIEYDDSIEPNVFRGTTSANGELEVNNLPEGQANITVYTIKTMTDDADGTYQRRFFYGVTGVQLSGSQSYLLGLQEVDDY